MIAVKMFAEGVAQKIKDYLPEEYQNVDCKVMEQQKNNGKMLTGILLEIPGKKIVPIIYMEPFYEQVQRGEPMDSIMSCIADVCEQSLSAQVLPENLDLMDYDSVKEYLSVQIINTKANQRMLSQVPHKEMEDLSIICKIEFSSLDGEKVGEMKVTYDLMRAWRVRPEEVYEKAMENAVKRQSPVLMSMEEVMEEMMGLPVQTRNLFQLEEGEKFPKDMMYVLSNERRRNGSSVLAYPGLQEQLEAVFPQGCYLLPVSLHEMLIEPKDFGRTPKELGVLVRLANQQSVIREEFLSDRVYEFDKESRQLRQVPDSIEKEKGMER